MARSSERVRSSVDCDITVPPYRAQSYRRSTAQTAPQQPDNLVASMTVVFLVLAEVLRQLETLCVVHRYIPNAFSRRLGRLGAPQRSEIVRSCWGPRAPSKSRFVLFVRGPDHKPAPHGGVDPGRKVGSGGRRTRTLGAYRDLTEPYIAPDGPRLPTRTTPHLAETWPRSDPPVRVDRERDTTRARL